MINRTDINSSIFNNVSDIDREISFITDLLNTQKELNKQLLVHLKMFTRSYSTCDDFSAI